MAEPGSDVVRDAMSEADAWFICRLGFVEMIRAIGLAAGPRATTAAKDEWPAFGIVEVDQPLVEHAAALALDHDLRSLYSVHLAAALLLEPEDLRFVTWDRRLHQAARAEGLTNLEWREVPTDAAALGELAQLSAPRIVQMTFTASEADPDERERSGAAAWRAEQAASPPDAVAESPAGGP